MNPGTLYYTTHHQILPCYHSILIQSSSIKAFTELLMIDILQKGRIMPSSSSLINFSNWFVVFSWWLINFTFLLSRALILTSFITFTYFIWPNTYFTKIPTSTSIENNTPYNSLHFLIQNIVTTNKIDAGFNHSLKLYLFFFKLINILCE